MTSLSSTSPPKQVVGLHTCPQCGAAIQYDDPHVTCGTPSRTLRLTAKGRAEAFRQKYGV
jgi:hypothetical protein